MHLAYEHKCWLFRGTLWKLWLKCWFVRLMKSMSIAILPSYNGCKNYSRPTSMKFLCTISIIFLKHQLSSSISLLLSEYALLVIALSEHLRLNQIPKKNNKNTWTNTWKWKTHNIRNLPKINEIDLTLR